MTTVRRSRGAAGGISWSTAPPVTIVRRPAVAAPAPPSRPARAGGGRGDLLAARAAGHDRAAAVRGDPRSLVEPVGGVSAQRRVVAEAGGLDGLGGVAAPGEARVLMIRDVLAPREARVLI